MGSLLEALELLSRQEDHIPPVPPANPDRLTVADRTVAVLLQIRTQLGEGRLGHIFILLALLAIVQEYCTTADRGTSSQPGKPRTQKAPVRRLVVSTSRGGYDPGMNPERVLRSFALCLATALLLIISCLWGAGALR